MDVAGAETWIDQENPGWVIVRIPNPGIPEGLVGDGPWLRGESAASIHVKAFDAIRYYSGNLIKMLQYCLIQASLLQISKLRPQ